jgi:hypothetical protein
VTLASVGRTNAFLVTLGKQARGLKLVPGGTRFAGLTCAGFGDVYKLGAMTVLDGPRAFSDLVTTKKGKDAQALATAFGLAGPTTWVPPAIDAETDRQFWSATAVAHGLRFAAEARDRQRCGLLTLTALSLHTFLDGCRRQPSLPRRAGRSDGLHRRGIVAFGEQRCHLRRPGAGDVRVLKRLVNETLEMPTCGTGWRSA